MPIRRSVARAAIDANRGWSLRASLHAGAASPATQRAPLARIAQEGAHAASSSCVRGGRGVGGRWEPLPALHGGTGDERHCRTHPAGPRRRRRSTSRIRLTTQSRRPNHSRSSASVAVFGSVTPLCPAGARLSSRPVSATRDGHRGIGIELRARDRFGVGAAFRRHRQRARARRRTPCRSPSRPEG